jgi:NTE family protein
MASGEVAFVLGGGGQLGAHEVGMLRALLERGITPDLVVGTSIGAINGAAVAADPTTAAVARLSDVWTRIDRSEAFDDSIVGRLATLARSRTHLHGNEALRALLEESFPVRRIEDLAVRFECVAACIETASERWFSSGPLVDAMLASSAVPGVLPPVEIDGEHFLDGGIVNSIPVGRAADLGARVIYVLHVGRVERGLERPRWPWEVGMVAFEIARRHRFFGDLAALGDDVEVHVMPTGRTSAPGGLPRLGYGDTSSIRDHIASAYEASARYLGGDSGDS